MKDTLRFFRVPVLIFGIPLTLLPSSSLLAMPQSGNPPAKTFVDGKGAVQTKPAAHESARALQPSPQQVYGRLPLQFEENRGQTDAQVKFLARGKGYVFFLTPSEGVLALRHRDSADASDGVSQRPKGRRGADDPSPSRWGQSVLRFELVGENPNPRMEPVERLPGISNYFIGNDPSKWRTSIPNYARIVSHNIYPGIDAAYYGKEGRLESDFIVGPGRDPGAIRLKITGAQHVEVNSAGELVLTTTDGDVKLEMPVLYQKVRGARRKVEGSYRLLSENEVGFTTGQYDRRRALVIDPTLVYSTYLGGSGASGDGAHAIAVDSTGAAYVTGFTSSADFPVTPGVFQSAPKAGFTQNAFVTKLAANGASLVFSTYVGGSGRDTGYSIAVDAAGEPYITGATSSSDFPKTSGPGLTNSSGNAFVTKLSANGSALMFSFYLGGNVFDAGYAIAVDGSGNAYVTGSTNSSNFPVTAGVFQGTLKGTTNAFVAKISAAGAVTWATYLGGEAEDVGFGIAVNTSNPPDVFVTGGTSSAAFPTQSPIQANLGGPAFSTFNAFVTELNPTGTMLAYSTYLGGSSDDEGFGIAVDSGGNAAVAGVSYSQDFPLVAPLQAHTQNQDLFVTKVAAGGGSFVFSTVFGSSSGQTEAKAVALDPSGNIYVAGHTSAYLLPTLDPLQGPSMLLCECGGGESFQTGMVMELKPDGSDYLFSTFFGGAAGNINTGSFSEVVFGIAADPQGNVYIAGSAASADFPTVGPFQATLNSPTTNAFVAKISPATPTGPQVFPSTLNLQTSALNSSTFPYDVTVLNGTNTLSFSSIFFTGPNAADFSEVDSCLPELLPHAVCTIEVRATPTASATETATLNIMDSDTSSPQLVALTVTVVTPSTPPTGTLTVMPSSLTFSTPQEVGTTSSAQSITLSNTGTVTVSTSIYPGGDFSLAAGGSCPGTFSVTLTAGTSCTVAVVFRPFSSGPLASTLQVYGNFTGSPASVNLSGTGFFFATLSPPYTTFSTPSSAQTVGSPSSTMFVTLSNASGSTTLTGISVSVVQFPPTLGYAIVSNSCGAALGPGLNCLIGLTYTPTTPGQTFATVQVTSSDPVTQTVYLFGYALNALATLAPISPTALNFGPVAIGTTGSSSAFLQNLGNVPLAVSESVTASGTNPAPADFTAMDTCAGVVPAGGGCILNVTFTPSAVGLRTALVHITSTTSGAVGVPQTVALTGSGSAPTTAAAAPATITFPNTLMGVTSAPLLATFTNTGTRPLVLTANAVLGGADPGDFSFTFPFNNPASLACGQFSPGSAGAQYSPQIACPISFTFTPTAPGMRTATFTIMDTASNSPHVVTLQGISANGSVDTISPNPLAFGNQPKGTPSGAMTLMFSNATGTGTLTITALMVTGNNPGDFTQVPGGGTCGALPISVNAGAACTLQFVFTPMTATSESAALMVTDSSATSPEQVLFTGTGTVPMISASPNPLAFGNQPKGMMSGALTLTFSNAGGAPLMITGGLAPTGGNAADFAQVAGAGTCSTTLPITIVAGSNCTVQYTFTPSMAAMESTTLQVANNSATNPYTVTLNGTGILPGVTFTPTAATVVNFGAVSPGTPSATQTVMLSVAAGTGTLQLSSISIAQSGVAVPDFAFAAGTTCPTTGGAVTTSCVVVMTFTPSMPATENATLTFAGTNLTGSPVTFPLTGIGASTAAGFTFTATSPSGGNGTTVSILPGDTATFTLVIQPNPGFIGPITVACMEMPTIPSTILTTSPATTINVTTTPSGPITVTCTLQTNCLPALVGPREPWNVPGPWTPSRGFGMAEVSGLALLLAMLCRKTAPKPGRHGERRSWALQLVPMGAAVLLVLLVMTWTACVSNPPAAIPGAPTTPAGAYQIQVVATAPGPAGQPPVKQTVSLTVHVL